MIDDFIADTNNIITTTKIVEENNYYPFGLKHKGYNSAITGRNHKYGFGGKEEQDDNVGGNKLDWLDFGARNYDASLGRWMNIDPLTEGSPDWTPFRYAYNNPLKYIDSDGMIERDSNTGKVKVTITERNVEGIVGNGQIDYQVRGNVGYITANDGETTLRVRQVDKYLRPDVGFGQKWIDGSDNPKVSTNCYGNSIADGDVVIEASNNQVARFLKADGYEDVTKLDGFKVQKGDILMYKGGHVMEATGVDENGKMQYTSMWASDANPVTGNIQEVQGYNGAIESSAGRAERGVTVFVFRPTEGDVYVDENGSKTTGSKVINENDKYQPRKINE